MKKKIQFILIVLSISISIFSVTIYVDGNNTTAPWLGTLANPYQYIQTAVDNAQNGDLIHVFYYYIGYEGFDFDGKSLDIFSQGSLIPIINGDLSSPSLDIVIDMTDIYNPNVAPPKLHGFKIIGSSSATGIKLTNFDGLSPAKTYNNVIDGLGTAIYVGDNQKRIEVTTNELMNNNIAYYSKETSTNVGFSDLFNYNTVYDNNTGLYLDYRSDISSLGNLLYDNAIGINIISDYCELSVNECTITNTDPNNDDTGIFISDYSSLTVQDCIIYGYDTQIDDDGGTITITYSDVEDGYSGTGNIDDDPLFCFEYPYTYHLLEGSPCIDTGDPTTTGGDVRIDMGCYETTTNIKECEGNHWNWVSFPRLDRDDDDGVDAPPILGDFLDWPFSDLSLLYSSNVIAVLVYDHPDWTPASYYVKSTRGYKLDPQDNGDHYLTSQSGATRLDADWELDLPANNNWMGYWLPYTQNIEVAFGDFWDKVVSVYAEDWVYIYSTNETPISSPTGKNMVYGKGYVVTFDQAIKDFYWTDAVNVEEEQEIMIPQNFSFNDLPDYESIDVMDIPENVLEIGVFEEDICVGAIVVQDTCQQILVYSTSGSRDQIPFSFEVITNKRGAGEIITKYQVMNEETGLYENRPLISSQQINSVIMFGNLENLQNKTPVVDNVILHGNYPNPFNPETNITFSLPQEQNIDIVVYNMKGQKVRQLVCSQISSGEHSITWNGKDDNGKNVGSGLYLYKLITTDQEISKKMLLLK